MAILSKISVGDINYCVVDSPPTHIDIKGSVAIVKSDTVLDGKIYINNDGNTTWLRAVSEGHGEAILNDYPIVDDWDNFTVNSWYGYPTTNWVEGSMNGFTLTNNQLTYTGTSAIKVVCDMVTTIRGGERKYLTFEAGVSLNNIVPTQYQESNTRDSNTAKGGANMTVDIMRTSSLGINDFFMAAFSPISREGGGNATRRQFITKHCHLSVSKLDEAILFYSQNWESGAFDDWITANDTTNVWVIGTAENNTVNGSYAAYISDNAGTSANYNVDIANISHIYKDITVPSNANDALLTFDWKCWGEDAAAANQYDYGTVVLTTTGTTPTSGTEVNTAQATLDGIGRPTGDGRIGAATNLGKFNLTYGGADNAWRSESIKLTNYIGQTKRIVFTWVNDGSVGNNPPFVVDNIKVQYF